MKNIIFFIPLFLIAKINGLERDLEKAPILMQSGSYTSLGSRAMTPDLPLEQQTVQDLKRRKTTLVTAISIKDVELAKSSFEKDFAWVNKLYLHQRFAHNQIAKTTHQELQERLLFARRLFDEIDTAIAKEDARQEWLRKFSAPGQIISACNECNCSDRNENGGICTPNWPQWSNISLTIAALAIAIIYCKTTYPSRLSTSEPCDILPKGQQAQMFLDCQQSSLKNRFPCEILNPNNATQIRLMEDCCQNLVNLFCLEQVDHYNNQVYPKQVWHAWRPSAIIVPSILAAQFAFQLGGYLYRRSKRLREPIKQFIVQKNGDLAQIEQDFSKLQIVDDSSFQEL